MKELEVIIKDDEGIHARPAALFVGKAKSYHSVITLEKNGEQFNAKNFTSVLSMGACKNDTILIRAEGADEDAAIAELSQVLRY